MLESEQIISSAVRELLSIPSLFPQQSTYKESQITLEETNSGVWKCTVEYPLQLYPQQSSSPDNFHTSITQLQNHISSVYSLLGDGGELYFTLPLSNENTSVYGYFSSKNSSYSLQSKGTNCLKIQFFIESSVSTEEFRKTVLKHISKSVYKYNFNQSRSYQDSLDQIPISSSVGGKTDPVRYSTELYTIISDSSFDESFVQFTQHPQIFFEDEFDFTFLPPSFEWPVHIFVHQDRSLLSSRNSIKTPAPIKSHLEKQPEFFNHIQSRLSDQFKTYFSLFYSTSHTSLRQRDIIRLDKLDVSNPNSLSNITQKIESVTGKPTKDLDYSLQKSIPKLLQENTYTILENTIESSDSLNSVSSFVRYVNENENSKLYVTVSENEMKQELVKNLHSEVVVIQLHSSQDYTYISDWSCVTKIADLSNNIHSYSLTQSQKETLLDLKTTGQTPLEYTTVKLRFGTNDELTTRTQTLTLQQLVKHMNGTKNYLSRFEPTKLIGFVNSDVTNHLQLGSPSIALLSVSDQQHQYLEENIESSVYRSYSEFISQAEELTDITTNDGTYTGFELQQYSDTMTTIVVPEYLKEKVIQTVTNISTHELLDVFSTLIPYNESQEIDLVVLLTPSEEKQLRPILEDKTLACSYFESTCYTIETVPNVSQTSSSFNGTKFYGLLEAHVSEAVPETILEFIKSSEFQSGKSAVNLIESFVHMECESS